MTKIRVTAPRRSPAPAPTRTRRDVLAGAVAAAGAACTSPSPYVRRQSVVPGGAEMLRVGLVGCGGRGTGAAANALRADPNVKLVALGDAFADPVSSALETLLADPEVAAKVAVDEEHRFVGFDAYRGVIESADVVLLATPPHFRPLHVEAAVAAKRHLFVEKPVATDAPGLRRMWQACRAAREARLSLVGGLCYRYERAKRETIQRVHDGMIGEIVAMQCTYHTNELWHKGRDLQWSELEYQLRNWLYFTWLSGDIIAEQHIHSLDKLAWAKGAYPVRCTSSGGRSKRTGAEFGNVYDHFSTVYEWEDGVRGFSSCRQWSGTAHDISDRVWGTRGSAELQSHEVQTAGERWRHRSEEPDDMYQNEIDELFRSIRQEAPIDDGDVMCRSTLMALMGRMSAYTGQTITAEQALASQEDLSPPSLEWGDVATPPVAVPGVTPFV